ncbi:MAG: 4'-phosphopantetheinyl transferase superfamily protein [Bacteriovorax sp.]
MKITHEVYISFTQDAFINSREALRRLLEKRGHEILDLKQDLELINYQHLKKFPEYLTSITHTRGAGASVLANKSDYLSLGIDIEWSDREMKPEAQRFFCHPEDSAVENKLKLWTMKEAAFKALSPLGHPGVLVLSKIIIQNGSFFTREKPELKGHVDSFIMPIEDRNLVVSIAYITRNKSMQME